MSEKWLCPRLADYLVIVGARSPDHSAAIQPPELLRRYPLDDHKDFPLPLDVVYFCQPEGCVSAGGKKPALRDAVSFVFTLTDKDSGKTRYGVCLNFYRSTDRPSTARQNPQQPTTARRNSWRKSIEKSSDSAFSSDHRSGVCPSDSEREASSRRDSEAAGTFLNPAPPTRLAPMGNESESGGSASPSPRPSRRRQRRRNHSLTSLCILSHHPFFSSFRHCLSLLKRIIDASDEKSSPRRVGASKLNQRDSLWGVLTGKSSDGNSFMSHDVREIETWILRFLSAPVPVPSSTRVELEVVPGDLGPPLLFALPDKTRFSLTDFPLHLPLELLGVDACIQVLTLIILECKVVIQSRDYSALSMSVLALVTMLYPLEYMFPVIPLLPTCMSCAEQLLLAPTPYIIGIPASFLPYKKHFRLPEDVWLVDLDSTRVSGPSSVERDSCDFIPSLPEPEASVLRNHLKQAMGRMDLEALASMSAAPFPELSGERQGDQPPGHPTNFNPLIYANDVDSVDVATRIAMVRFFNSQNLLANFSEHTRTLRLYPRPVVAFQISSFLRSRPNPPSHFLVKFARTQAVEYLAEWSLTPTNLAFLRVQTGVFDPTIIGDKAKWFATALTPIRFSIHADVPSLIMSLRSEEVSAAPTDESGSDSEGGGSGESTSSYSSLSDFVSELASSDLSPSGGRRRQRAPPLRHVGDEPEEPQSYSDRNVRSLCSSLDLSTVYRPPSSLQLPGDYEGGRKGSGDSGSPSDSVSSASSKGEEGEEKRRSSQGSQFTIEDRRGSVEPSKATEKIQEALDEGKSRHGSFGSTFGQFASHAKELVKETKRQSSQEGLLSQVDKLKTRTKERLSEVKRQGSSGSSDDASHFSPLEILTNQAKKAAEEAGKSVQAGLSSRGFEDLTHAGKSTWEDLTKTAKKGLLKSLGESGDSGGAESRRSSFERRESGASITTVSSGRGLAHQQTHPPPHYPERTIHLPHQAQSQPGLNTPQRKDFFSNMSTELNGLANQTTSIFSELFGNKGGAPGVGRGSPGPPAIAPPTRPKVEEGGQSHGPFPTGKKGLVERSSLIRHSTAHLHPQKGPKGEVIKQMGAKTLQKTGNTSAENQSFLNEIATAVLNGEGVGWLRVGRLKKLLEDESYRVLLVAKINKTLEKKVGPDDHIDDVIVPKGVWKGMLKLLQLLVAGLEYSYANRGLGGMASAFQVMEIAHTHYWSKELVDGGSSTPPHYAQFLDPHGGSPGVSVGNSPISSAQISPDPSRRPSALSAENPVEGPDQNTSDMLRDLLQNKKSSLLARLSSSETHVEEKGSIDSGGSPMSPANVVLNPAWGPANLPPKPRLASRLSQMSLRSTVSDTELEQGGGRGKRSPSVWSSKSALAAGLRYHAGSLIPTGSSPTSPEGGRMYLFEGLMKERANLWDEMQFWEDAFLDAVAQERELVGMDQGPREMMERYQSLSDSEKKRLEHEEDRLLATLLFNLVAFMLMMAVNSPNMKQKIRRLLGKSHMGLVYSQEINQLLEQVGNLKGNAVDLKPAGSRLSHRQTFAVHAGAEPLGNLLFMEVRDDGIVVRNVGGAIVERWWWERLVNMTYSPKTRVVCLWRRNGGQTQLGKYHSRKCRALYGAIKEAMERAAARGGGPPSGADLGGEFPVEDLKTGQGGLLQVCMEGVGLLFANSKFFVRLDHIRKCFTQKGGIFVLEEFNPKTRQVLQRKYKSAMEAEQIALSIHRIISVSVALSMAENICYSVLCVFSYMAAGKKNLVVEKS